MPPTLHVRGNDVSKRDVVQLDLVKTVRVPTAQIMQQAPNFMNPVS